MIIDIKDGIIKNTSIKTDIYSQIEKGAMNKVNAIVLHQTGSSSSASAYSSYKSGQNGAHFLIEKDGRIVQTTRINQKCWLVACDSNTHRNGFTDIQIIERGFESGGEFCNDFTLQEKEIQQFLLNADMKTPHEIHDEFDSLPCFIRGTSTHQQQTVTWEIRAGGTARVTYPDGSQIEFDCTDCF